MYLQIHDSLDDLKTLHIQLYPINFHYVDDNLVTMKFSM